MNSNLAERIIDAVKTSFVDSSWESNEDLRARLLYNDVKKGNTVLANLDNELKKCEKFWMSIAFITSSGLIVLKETLKELEQKGIEGRILTTDYLNFNDPNALRDLLKFSNIEVRVFDRENFHTKGYMFEKKDRKTFIVGSSNLTQNALKKNKEWNLKVTSLENGELVQETEAEFIQMWEEAVSLSNEWIDEYSVKYEEQRKTRISEKITSIRTYILKPNKMQIEATRALDELRKNGENKALLISATGTGKTYLSAFDVRNFKPKKMLFLVHREQILKQAMKSFKDVLGNGIKMGYLSGSHKDVEADYLFSTVQMMSKEYIFKQFAIDCFDYIIIDETHKAGAGSYHKIMKHFKPKFLLGMTATPERTDEFNVFKLFDNNIAYEIRLQQAMEEDMLCPFHYFGVSELLIDGEVIDEFTDFRKLISEIRVENIIEKMQFYGHSGERVKGLVFCSRQDEAIELSKLMNIRGYQTVALCAKDSPEKRERVIERLEQKNREGGLDYIFTIDIFNEGVDIPSVNQVVMLRPTQSSIIFIQQLGRGLRKYENKEYVVVIDFIGNYNKNFLIPIALSGDRSYNKDSIRKFIAEGNRVIPGCSTINFDAIAKQRIYAAIDIARFNDIRLIKEEYKKLKNMLGRIPELIDFEKYGSIDVMRIFENKTIGSYYNFLKKYDLDYRIRIPKIQEEMLEFISRKIANGKRIHELYVLNRLLRYQSGIMNLLAQDLQNDYGKQLTDTAKMNVACVLTNSFVTSEIGRKKFSNSIFLEEDGGDFKVSQNFQKALQNEEFYKLVDKLIKFGISRYNGTYGKSYKETDFELYRKYTYEDVCKLLDWNKNIVAQNIGGYKFDEETNTFPVFINYNKEDTINDSIKYEDRFLTPSRLIALSKQPRTRESKDVQQIYHAKEKGTKIYLFVRKNKDDSTSKEFYFLGEMYAVGEPNPVIMKNTDKNAVEITYQLETSVREDLYEYLTQ